MGGSGVDLASAVNADIEDSMYHIYKIHWRPREFIEQISSSPKYVVYICRDPRDVVISSYFYFTDQDESEWKVRLRTKGVRGVFERVVQRRRLSSFLGNFLEEGIGEYGTWAAHVEQWRDYLSQKQSRVKSVLVKYEDLLEKTAHELQRICAELDLSCPPPVSLAEIVEKEGIDRLRGQSAQMHTVVGTFEPQYFRRFFRKGQSGDWKNYLSKLEVRRIERTCGHLMDELGYRASAK